MIILDTNVLSEVMRASPDAAVINWLERQPRTSLFTTTVTQAEILYGVLLLPSGKRRTRLEDAVYQIFALDFEDRILEFDQTAARAYADIAALRRQSGNPISQFDAMIAALGVSRGAQLATRNVKDFADCGITVINPWES